MRFTPDNVTHLAPNEIFVFGSNEAGIHGAGAARLAFKKFGAVWGVGVGHEGQTYAIPTKDFNIKSLDIAIIEKYVNKFIKDAISMPEFTFLVTKIGCGLAGFSVSQIAPMFKDIPKNVILPEDFFTELSVININNL